MPETCEVCGTPILLLESGQHIEKSSPCMPHTKGRCKVQELRVVQAELARLRAELATERNRATVALEWLAAETSIPSDDMDKAVMLMDGAAGLCAVCVGFTKAEDMHDPYDGSELARCCTACMDAHELWPQKEPSDA